MYLSKAKSIAFRNFVNAVGKKIQKRIIVFESDDWGSIRMPSKQTYDYLLKQGIPVDKNAYEKNDSLESETDITCLFDVLMKYRDKNGNHPIITANTVMSNPDFDKIKADNFTTYHYELFFDTYERYYANKKQMIKLWKDGIKEQIFIPQFHGREHYKVDKWLDSLRTGDKQDLYYFDLGIVGLISHITHKIGSDYLVVLNSKETCEIEADNQKLIEGLDLFEKLFSFRSKTFIAPCYTWSPSHEYALKKGGVTHFQGISMQRVPYSKSKFHYLGMRNNLSQKYTVRNAFFEPSKDRNAVDNCLNRIENAFFWHVPAVISVHRLNFCGEITEANRSTNIKLFDSLLKKILKRWPDVEFMSSDQLATLI